MSLSDAAKRRKRDEDEEALISKTDRRLLDLISAHARNGTAVFDGKKQWFGTYGDWSASYGILLSWIRIFVISALQNISFFLVGINDADMFKYLEDVLDQVQESVQLERGFDFEDSNPFDETTEDGQFLIRNIKRYATFVYALYDEGLNVALKYFVPLKEEKLLMYQELEQPWKSDVHPKHSPDVCLQLSLAAAKKEVEVLEEIIKYDKLIMNFEMYSLSSLLDDGIEDCMFNMCGYLNEKEELAFSGIKEE